MNSNEKKKKKKGDNSSSVSIKSSTHNMAVKMKKDLQNTNKLFAAMEFIIMKIEEKEEDSDISDLDSESGLEFIQM